MQVSITSRGRRADGYRQFLMPVLNRDNLTVVTRAQTKRVVMENRGGKPTAVAVEVQGVLVRPAPHG
jgi:choline dehydrogenase-like flavoprotein